jgi:nickel-dependent lactate racemase
MNFKLIGDTITVKYILYLAKGCYMLSDIKLLYGDQEKNFTRILRVNQTLRPNNKKALADPRKNFLNAISEPKGDSPLIEKIGEAKKIAIIIGDRRKIKPQIAILKYVLDLLKHLPQENISLFLASGNRGKLNLKDIKMPAEIIEKYKFISHDSKDETKSIYVGVTQSNTQVRVNRELLNFDLKIGIDIIRPHLFAGFTGGGQIIIPGLAHTSTIDANHSMRVKESCLSGNIDDNYVKNDMNEGSEFLDNLFVINSVLTREDEFFSIVAGSPSEAFEYGAKSARSVYVVPAKQTDIAIITGGPRFTTNLYEAGKLLGAAGLVLKPGGIAILVAKCANGTGNQEEFLNNIYNKSLVNHLPRDHKIYLVSDLPQDKLKDTIYTYFPTLDEAQEAAVKELGKNATLSILHNTEYLIPEISG